MTPPRSKRLLWASPPHRGGDDDPGSRRPHPRHRSPDARRRQHRRAGPPVVHRLGRRAGPGCPRDQRRHRRRPASHARREGPDHQGRPRRDRPADRGRPRRPVDRRGRPPGPRLPCRRRRRPARLPDPGLPELAAQPRRPGRVPHRDRRGRPAADPVPAPAGAGRRELRERRPPGDGRSRWRRGDQGGVVRCPPVRRHGPAARAAAEEDHAPDRQRQLHPRVVPARRDGRADRVRRGHDPRTGRHDPGLAGRSQRRRDGPRAPRPAAGRRRVRGSGRRLPRPAQGVPPDPRRAGGGPRPPPVAADLGRGAGVPHGRPRGGRPAARAGQRRPRSTDGGRTRGRPDHRGRRIGRRRRQAPRRGRLRRRVPRAGRLARPRRLPGQQARLGAEGAQGLGDQPEHPRTRAGLPDRRGRHPGLAAHVQRRRRLDDHLRRRLAARASVRLPRPLARRRRRRLADRLLRAAAVLLPDRPRLRRVRAARRPGVPARHRGRADAAAADRVGRAQGRARHDQAGLALVAGVQLDQLGRRTTGAGRASSAAPASRAATRARRRRPT